MPLWASLKMFQYYLQNFPYDTIMYFRFWVPVTFHMTSPDQDLVATRGACLE